MKVSNLKDGRPALRMTIVYYLPLDEFRQRICYEVVFYGKPLPLTRHEALEYAINQIGSGIGVDWDFDDDVKEMVELRLLHLYPELKA